MGSVHAEPMNGIELKRKKKDTELAEEEKNLDLKQVSGKISYGKWEISYRIFEKEECRCQIPGKKRTRNGLIMV